MPNTFKNLENDCHSEPDHYRLWGILCILL